jgi:hypothetical protein
MLNFISEKTPIENIYRFAAALYTVAEHEAQGSLSHWDNMPTEQLQQVQREAVEFINEWRGHFAHRLQPSAVPAGSAPIISSPFTRTPRKRSKIRRPIGVTYVDRIVEYLKSHGHATPYQIADALGCSKTVAYSVFSSHPQLFCRVGYTRTESDRKMYVWGLR